MSDFLGFRVMVSTGIIMVIYILGLAVLTIGGFVRFIQGGVNSLIGLGIIIFGNLLWRVFCEGWILIFSVHDILGSIEKKLVGR
jgi:cytochrome c biogenesis protein CcdA